ncbi:MAG: flagellar hook-associated protein FlgK, partial [candidate division WS1 bacterium]|nr:flagellar hook-associated protein FlgK [candidate division WS1 bacterium]
MSLRMITIANTALHTQRSALEVIGHNVANAETPGYVRQRPVIAAIPGVTRNDAGGGAELVAINLLRDELLATQIRHESGLLGRDSGLRNTLVQVEQIFTDVTSGGLAQRIEEMFDAWGDLGLQPSSTAARQQVLERSHLAAESISDRWEALAGLRREVDQRLNALVDRVNMLAREVAEINAKLPGTGSLSGRNDLETRRNGIINQLADLCGAEVVRQEGGVVDVIIGGRRLVDHASVTELSLVDDPAQPGLHLIALGDEVSPDGLRGEIAGRLQARDEIIPRYLDQLDALA